MIYLSVRMVSLETGATHVNGDIWISFAPTGPIHRRSHNLIEVFGQRQPIDLLDDDLCGADQQ